MVGNERVGLVAHSVEDLAQYGNALDDFPKGLMLRQARIFLAELYRRYGAVGVARLVIPVVRHRRRVPRTHEAAVDALRSDWGRGAVIEAVTMVALFNALTPIEGHDGSYEVIREIFQRVAPHSMAALYQSDDLARCAGDRFTNFKTFHRALFDTSEHLFPNTQSDEGDLFTSTVTQCANVEVFTGLGCPELGRLGRDHDLAGYPAIADRHDFEFRRPSTIAKGGDTCEFRFLPQGHRSRRRTRRRRAGPLYQRSQPVNTSGLLIGASTSDEWLTGPMGSAARLLRS